MVTMREIAHKAGVSVSTVSLVLSGKDSGRVNTKDAARIRQLAHDMGYTMNPLARSLRTNRTKILGFVSEEVATTLMPAVLFWELRMLPVGTGMSCSLSILMA